MAITFTNKASLFTGSNATSYATASQTPTASRLQLAVVVNANNLVTDPATPTLSGNGMTWSQVATYLYDTAGTKIRMTVFAALTGASPSAGAVTADFGAETQLGCNVIVDESNGEVDVSGTALQAVVQSVTGSVNTSGTSESITLAALASANNASWGAFSIQQNEALTAGSGYTITQQGGNAGPSLATAAEYKAPGSTTVDISWTTSAAKGGIALEIKAAGNFLTAAQGSFAENGQALTMDLSMTSNHGSFS